MSVVKLKKIAVIFRGQVRTWHHIKSLVFKYFSEQAEQIDFYFITWDIPGLDLEKLTNSFQPFNLIKGIKVTVNDLYYNYYVGPWYLQKTISPFVEAQHERDPYDAIINTRFDILPFGPVWEFDGRQHRMARPKQNELYCCWATEDQTEKKGWMSDVYLLSDISGHKVLKTIFDKQIKKIKTINEIEELYPNLDIGKLREQLGNNHKLLWRYLRDNKITVRSTQKKWLIIRPQTLNYYQDLSKIIGTENFANTNLFSQHWNLIDRKRQIHYCKKYELNGFDFNLDNDAIKLYNYNKINLDATIAREFQENFHPMNNPLYVPYLDRKKI